MHQIFSTTSVCYTRNATIPTDTIAGFVTLCYTYCVSPEITYLAKSSEMLTFLTVGNLTDTFLTLLTVLHMVQYGFPLV